MAEEKRVPPVLFEEQGYLADFLSQSAGEDRTIEDLLFGISPLMAS